MAKSLLYRLFGVGKVPAAVMSELKNEGILLLDEGMKGSATYHNFRSPGRRSSWRRTAFPASIALTKMRLLALSYTKSIINVPLADERIKAMRCSLERDDRLCIAFDAAPSCRAVTSRSIARIASSSSADPRRAGKLHPSA